MAFRRFGGGQSAQDEARSAAGLQVPLDGMRDRTMQQVDNIAGDAWSLELPISGREGTDGLAQVVARHVSPGAVVLLDGELAAGKTHFVKALVSALGSTELVTSPTYALVHVYDRGTLGVVHVDAYRLSSLAEFDDLGLDDYRDEALIVVEWGKLVEDRFPERLTIEFAFVQDEPEARRIVLKGRGRAWKALHSTLLRTPAGSRP